MHISSLKKIAWLGLILLSHSNHAFANLDKFKNKFYLGISGGYGSTTWNGLVPPEDRQNYALTMYTPTEVHEGGVVWGFFAGYEFLPYFALEAFYQHYPDATVTYDENSIFTYLHEGLSTWTTRTEVTGLTAKVMMFIPTTDIRLYSSFGAAEVHRSDSINDNWVASPTFGAGLNYNFTDRIMGELGANYTAGRGEAELSPAEDYFPFLYSVFLRIAYRFR